ncbi:antibiotic biosynthesis monooxygenase [Streptantibioticus rubrisoli]|uniref:Antibiotic biosynthesis monooxygenase n=1 Tax=Streptantibioticus rubrisoli TaxID=1387313 RepID=A0ABT1P6G2_9ACTN|nr:antibiotic biosynthesis monooxygenase [Streptantibioticus rubrisoli]MCQ4040973.1 antibiotic biosynthesis monooxygenase [Streptantibioticus rubrisoli]
MTSHRPPFPDLTRTDAGTTLLSEWVVGAPERQRAAAEALLGEWHELSARFRPDAFLRLSCFASADGRVLLSHAQWASDQAHLAFAREHRQDMVNRIDQAVPGIERPGLSRYRLLHSVVPDGAPDPAEAITLLHVTTASADQARRWVDATAAALRRTPPAGISAAHLLAGTDGDRAVLYAVHGHDTGAWPPPLPTAAEGDVHVHQPRHYRLLGSVLGPGGNAHR